MASDTRYTASEDGVKGRSRPMCEFMLVEVLPMASVEKTAIRMSYRLNDAVKALSKKLGSEKLKQHETVKKSSQVPVIDERKQGVLRF